jgi:DNA polymerase III alpha subunit
MANDVASTLDVDDWGRVVASYDQAIEVLMSGLDLVTLNVQASPELDQYNEMCQLFDKTDEVIRPVTPLAETPEVYHARRSREWVSPVDSSQLWDELLEKCTNAVERERFVMELEEFSKRGMLEVLVQLDAMVKVLDAANVVRGVGRGSSVASFILYLMGVHFIDPIKYNLEVNEFLK